MLTQEVFLERRNKISSFRQIFHFANCLNLQNSPLNPVSKYVKNNKNARLQMKINMSSGDFIQKDTLNVQNRK